MTTFIKKSILHMFACVLIIGCTKSDSVPGSNNKDNTSNVMAVISLYAGSETERGSADNNDPLKARFDHPRQLALDGNILWVADGYSQSSLRKIDLTTGKLTTAIPWNNFDGAKNWRREIYNIKVNPATHKVLMVIAEGELWEYDPATGGRKMIIGSENASGHSKSEDTGPEVGSLDNTSIMQAYGLAVSQDGKYVYISDNIWGVVKKIDMPLGTSTVYAGKKYNSAYNVTGYNFTDGLRLSATFGGVDDLAVDQNNQLIIVDNGWSCIRRIAGDNIISLTGHNPGVSVSGLNVDGPINKAVLNRPEHVAITDAGIYFNGYGAIRLLRLGKEITSLHADYSKVNKSGALSASIAATPDGKTVYEAQGNVIYKYEVQQ